MKILYLLPSLIVINARLALAADSEIGIYETLPDNTVQTLSDKHRSDAEKNGREYKSSSVPDTSQYTNTAKPSASGRAGTISIRCNVDSARVIINKVNLGATPYIQSGFLPGLYEIELKKEGFATFRKIIRLNENDTAYIDTQLTRMVADGQSQDIQTIEKSESVPDAGELPEGKTPPSYQPPAGNATILVTCNTDSAVVVINKVSLGRTPYARRGFLPGFYEVELKKSGFEPFSKMIHLGETDTVRVEAELVSYFGRLIVASTPPAATVLLNEAKKGETPFDSAGIMPGLYRMRIELPEYSTWTGDISIRKNSTDSVGVSLMSIAARDSINKVNLRRFRIVRRVVFGTFTVGLTSAGIYYNGKAARQLERERDAWSLYEEENLSGNEYSARFEAYRKIAETTDSYMKNRNRCYLFGLLCAVGLGLSIPF